MFHALSGRRCSQSERYGRTPRAALKGLSKRTLIHSHGTCVASSLASFALSALSSSATTSVYRITQGWSAADWWRWLLVTRRRGLLAQDTMPPKTSCAERAIPFARQTPHLSLGGPTSCDTDVQPLGGREWQGTLAVAPSFQRPRRFDIASHAELPGD